MFKLYIYIRIIYHIFDYLCVFFRCLHLLSRNNLEEQIILVKFVLIEAFFRWIFLEFLAFILKLFEFPLTRKDI
jgi:hypothetical protein